MARYESWRAGRSLLNRDIGRWRFQVAIHPAAWRSPRRGSYSPRGLVLMQWFWIGPLCVRRLPRQKSDKPLTRFPV